MKIFYFRLRGYHPLGLCFPAHSPNKKFCNSSANKLARLCLTTPNLNRIARHVARYDLDWVWAVSFSLAATCEISIDLFSSWYWNVLLPRVRSYANSAYVIEVHSMGFPHSDISGSKVARHLPEAYRRHAASFIASSSQGIHHTLLDSRQEIQKPQYMLAWLGGRLQRTSSRFSRTTDSLQHIRGSLFTMHLYQQVVNRPCPQVDLGCYLNFLLLYFSDRRLVRCPSEYFIVKGSVTPSFFEQKTA